MAKRPLILGYHRESSPIWLIIFSDMSTNFMLFFLMLFAMTRMTEADRSKLLESMENAMVNKQAIEQRQQVKQAEENTMIALKDTLTHGRLKQYAKVEETEDKVKITIEMPFFFDTGKADINPEAKQALQGLVAPIKNFPHMVLIEGHTDNVPITRGRYPSNWELSVARAVSVINFMVSRGVPASKLVAGGYGQYRSAYENDTPEHRALNRRIEITLIKTEETGWR